MRKYSTSYKSLLIVLLFTIVSIFFGAQTTLAHTPHDIVEALEISPNYDQDKTVFIAISAEGLLKSTDGGYSWKRLVNGLDNKEPVSSIAISPAFETDQTAFISTGGGGIYRSQDGGASWVKVNSGLNHLDLNLLSISPNYETDNILLAADTHGNLYKTVNGGANWYQVLDTGTLITAMVFFTGELQNTVLIGDHQGDLYLSKDGGEHWQMKSHFGDAGGITSIAVSPNVSGDGTVFVGTEKGGIFKTVDKAASFTAVNSGLLDSSSKLLGYFGSSKEAPKSIRSVVMSPDYATDSTVFASTWYEAVFKSTDAGNNWQVHGQGVTSDTQADSDPLYKSPHFRNLRISKTYSKDHTIFLEGYDGLFKSTDGGQVWTQMETLTVGQIWRLGISPAEKGDATIGITTVLGGAYTMDQQGLSWTVNNGGLTEMTLLDIGFSPNYLADSTMFLTSNNYFFKSTDRGHTWDAIDLRYKGWRTRFTFVLRRWGMPKRWVTKIGLLQESEENRQPMFADEIVVSPNFAADSTIYFGTRRRGVYKSIDGGLNWSPIWPNREISALVISPAFSSDRTLFAGTRGEGVYKTADGGESWHPVNNGLITTLANAGEVETSLAVDITKADIKLMISPSYQVDQTLFAGSAEGLFRTTNGGESWQKSDGLAQEGHGYVLGMSISPDYENDQCIMVSVRGRGIFKSSDGGLTFTEIGPDLAQNNYFLELIEFSPSYPTDNTVYAASDEELFQSMDGGQSWEILPRPIRYEDRREMIRYEGQWKVLGGNDFSATSVTHSDQPQVKAVLDFVGTGVTWLGTRSNDQGIARVYIDGEYKAEVDQFNDTQESMVSLYSIADLDHGPHTITIEVSETKNPASAGYRVAIDAFDILP